MRGQGRRRRRFPLFWRVVLGVVVALGVFVAVDFDWSGKGKRPPTETIEYDDHQWVVTRNEYLRARGLDIEDVPPEENAALDYLIAGEMMPDFPSGEERKPANTQERYVLQYGWPADCKVLRRYLSEAQPALARARIGLGKERPRWLVGMDEDLLYNAELPGLGRMRTLSRAFVCTGWLAVSEGRDGEALECFLAPIHLGNHVAHGPVVLYGLVGAGVNGMGFSALERWILGEPSVKLLREAHKQIRELEKGKPDYLHAVGTERAMCLDVVRFFGKYRIESLRELRAVSGPVFGRSRLVRGVVKRKLNAAYDRIEHWAVLEGRAKYGLLASLPDEIRNDAEGDWHVGEFAYILWSTFRYERKFALNDLRYAAVQVRIGLALYKAEHGRYPEALEEIEAYLGDVPLDPYTLEPLRYRLEGDEYVFYSVGPNLLDEGGKDRRQDRTRLQSRFWGSGGSPARPIGLENEEMETDDLFFVSDVAEPPPFEEFMKHRGRRPEEGWSTERAVEGD